jgi:glycosyltransferase involved in cell wall biosynthesis
MPQPETTQLIQVTTSLGWGGWETLPLAIHRWRLERNMPSQLVVATGSRLADHAGNTDGAIAIPRGRAALARALRRILRKRSGESVIVCHFTRDLASIRAALIGDTCTPLLVVKHVSPGPPKHDLGHKFLYRRVNRLLAVSEYVRQKCARVYPIDVSKTSVWHPGVDTDRFAFDPELRERLRTEAGVTPDAIVMGYVARITPNKGLEDLIDAAGQLHESYPYLRLWIAGSSSPDERAYEQSLHERIATLGIAGMVRFAGWQEKPEGFLSAIDLFVVPSQREAFGLSTVEAMACARPVVGFKAAGTAEIVADQETGLLADPDGNAAANLKGTIRVFLNQSERILEMGQQGRARVEALFSHRSMMDRLHSSLRMPDV